jgi:glycosyltransferase involved in cell wall biosynthesis
MPPVSIIIPCLNEEHYIGKLLASLASQSFRNFEVIIVDGNSTDKTHEIINSFIASSTTLGIRVQMIIADTRGVSYQRNLGVKNAAYENLLFLDSDVQLKENFLELSLHEFEKKELDLGTARFAPISRKVVDQVGHAVANVYIQFLQYIQPVAVGWCIFSTKRIHDKINGFDEKMNFSEDYDYIKRACNAGGKFAVLLHGRVLVSVRRLEKEGRFNYLKKALTSEGYRFMHGKVDKELFKYEFGKFKHNTEVMQQDAALQVKWKKFVDSFRKLTSE